MVGKLRYSSKSLILSHFMNFDPQEAFERHRTDFISKSRERMRKVKLAAEERQVQAQFDVERAQIFHDQRSKKSNPNAHPLSGELVAKRHSF